MKKKLIATAVGAIALINTAGATTAFAADNVPPANEFFNQVRVIRMDSHSGISDEQREIRLAERKDLFTQVFTEISLPTMTDEQRAERQSVRHDSIVQAFEDGLISQELFDIIIATAETGRGTEFNTETIANRMGNRNALLEQLDDNNISQELLDALMTARTSAERSRGNIRDSRFLQQ